MKEQQKDFVKKWLSRFLKSKWFYVSIIILIGGLIWVFWGGKSPVLNVETALVQQGNVVRVVSETGVISAVDSVNLAFTTSGRINSVLVKKGETVRKGQALVQLNRAQAEANLAQAQAALRAVEAQIGSSGNIQSKTKQQQDQLVESARVALMTTDLQAYLTSNATGENQYYDSPVITGTYTCDREGSYELRLYQSVSVSGYSLAVSGIENDFVPVSIHRPEPIGSCGLFIQFPERFFERNNAVWSVPIPNTRSATYTSRLTAYESALKSRDLAITSAENTVLLSAELEQATAQVRSAEAALADMTLRAPFDGVVTDLSATLGQIVTPGAALLTVTSIDQFEISVSIPEDDIMGITLGDKAEVTFDALRDVNVPAEVVYVAPVASQNTEFVSFEVVLRLEGTHPDVRSGLSADVDIIADSRQAVVVVPVRAVIEENGQRYVRVLTAETTYRKVPVVVGLRGDGLYEIVSGLTGGEKIITFATAATIATLIETQ